MISAIVGLFNLVRGLFVSGGMFATFFTWLSTSTGWFATTIVSIGVFFKDFFLGTVTAIKKTATYIAAYHIVELARRFFLVGLIVAVFGWIINYVVNNALVFNNKSLAQNFQDFINSFSSFGALGQDFLALLTHLGIFQALSIILTVMIYVLFIRVALSILFK